MSVAKIIKTQRKEAHLTQRDIGHIIGVTTSTVTRWENGSRSPSLSVFIRIMELTGADVLVVKR